MFPNNQTSGYVTEMNRLFSMQPENDTSQMANLYSSSPFQATDRSSSSADSTSPESYSDMAILNRRTYDPNLRPIFETPRPTNQNAPKRRPIVGRKILETTKSVIGSPLNDEFDIHSSSPWQNEVYSRTPPNSKTSFVEQKNYTRNDFYELFPEKISERTPHKANLSPIMLNYSPTSSNQSNFSPPSIPRISTPSIMRPLIPTFPTPPLFSTPHYPAMSGNSSRVQDMHQTKMCSLCRKNGETPIVYMMHNLKEKVENKHIVTCPILRAHVCSICGASGDDAHTITYCPVLRSSNNGVPLRSTTVTLKNTRLKSNGRRRY